MAISSVRHVAEQATHEAGPWIERLARFGYVAKAALYVTIGLLAATAGLGLGGDASTDTHGAMARVISAPFGRGLLAAIAIGLLGYGVWRCIEGVLDLEGRGKDWKGVAHRVRQVGTGLIHLGLAYSAAQLVLGAAGASSGDRAKQHWAARALDAPYGEALVWLIAAGLLGYGGYQIYNAIKAKLSKQLELGRCPDTTRRWLIGISRFGIASRGVVFVTIGVLFGRAASQHDSKEAGGVAASLRELFDLGKWPFVAIALGLVAYGVYELVNAKYRRLNLTSHR
jgi:hypothetical protein